MIKKLIKQYLKKREAEILHDIRVLARRKLAKLEQKNKTDLYLKQLMKLSSKTRDIDVLNEKCSNKKVVNYLEKIRKKEQKNLFKFLKSYKSQIVHKKMDKTVSKNSCLKVCKINLLKLNDKELHKIRILIKKCRYSFNLENLKQIQTDLGEAHDYYNCIKLKKRFNLKYKKEEKLKLKFIHKAQKEVKKICKRSLK